MVTPSDFTVGGETFPEAVEEDSTDSDEEYPSLSLVSDNFLTSSTSMSPLLLLSSSLLFLPGGFFFPSEDTPPPLQLLLLFGFVCFLLRKLDFKSSPLSLGRPSPPTAQSSSAPDELPCEAAALPVSSPTLLPLSTPESDPTPSFPIAEACAPSSSSSPSSSTDVAGFKVVLVALLVGTLAVDAEGGAAGGVLVVVKVVATAPPAAAADEEEVEEEEVVSLFVFGLVVVAGLDSKP